MTRSRNELTAAVSLPEFLSTHEVGTLSVDDRRLIVQQALLMLEQNYALLLFKVARYGINPLQRLRLMQVRLGRPDTLEPEVSFHAELVDIYNSLRDLHTRYTLPRPFDRAAAFLPFLLKEFTEDGRRRYLVGRRWPDDPELPDETFRFGVEMTQWNGVPIARAIERFAERIPGANPDARHARAVDRFTFRSLGFGPPPDEELLTIGYIDHQGQNQQIDLRWRVSSFAPGSSDSAVEEATASEVPFGIDVEAVRVARMRTLLFAPEFIAAEESGEPAAPGPDGIEVTPEFSTMFEARTERRAGDRMFGHLRIRTFMPPEGTQPTLGWLISYVREFIRLLGELPQDGLVVDIRGNPGGVIFASELCLQALTARPLEPEPAQFAATMLNLRICRAKQDKKAWLPSMEQALETGATHSAGVPLTPKDWLAEVPQSYFGPVVLVTDARCYSAADIFAAGFQDNGIGAGFQDNGIGTVLGVHDTTGAGGGNVWNTKNLLDSLPAAPDSPFRPLPGFAELSLVVRRVLRVGPNAGAPLEDYGVRSKHRHEPTRSDIMNDDADLMVAAARLLDKGVPRRFDVELSEAGAELTATFGVLGIDRADVIVDGRPRLTVDLGGNPGPVVVPGAGTPKRVRIEGYDHGVLVAARTFVREGTALQLRTTLEELS
jgi:hypothetical protein